METYMRSYDGRDMRESGFGIYGTIPPEGGTAFLYRLLIDPDNRRKGHARKLYDGFEQTAKEKGCDKIRVSLDPQLDPGLIKLLEKTGFSLVDKEKLIYEKNI